MASEADLENFERRAAEAEAQIAALEKRLVSVEGHAPSAAPQDLTRVLDEVRRILSIVQEEEKAAKKIVEERDKLKLDNERLSYRVNVLLRALDEEESKNRSKN